MGRPSIQISLCMIVRDEGKNLRQCLDSIQEDVDEIIIVDTGSKDNTKQIAGEFTDKIYDFQWCDDFSKARNFSLSKATKQWILFIDADERLSKEDMGKIKQIIRGNLMANAFTFKIKTYTNEMSVAGWISSSNPDEKSIATGFWMASAVRLFENKAEHFFEGRIHESPRIPIEKSKGKIIHSGLTIEHFGALNPNFEDKKKQYIELLEKRIKEREFEQRPENIICKELASELIQAKRYLEAIPYLEKAAKITQTPMDLMNLGATYLYLKDLDNAEKTLLQAIQKMPNNPDICINLGIVYLRKKYYNKAIEKFKQSLSINPSSANACFHLGLAFLRQNKKNESLSYFKKALSLNPNYKQKINDILFKYSHI